MKWHSCERGKVVTPQQDKIFWNFSFGVCLFFWCKWVKRLPKYHMKLKFYRWPRNNKSLMCKNQPSRLQHLPLHRVTAAQQQRHKGVCVCLHVDGGIIPYKRWLYKDYESWYTLRGTSDLSTLLCSWDDSARELTLIHHSKDRPQTLHRATVSDRFMSWSS